MAFAGNRRTTGPAPHTFKGHPQPPVDERLQTAKNFLADEDPDRCRDFEDRITEIEEYVADIEKQNLPNDAVLLRDVKVMIKEHRDWEKTTADGWKNAIKVGRLLRLPFSNRLIDQDTSALGAQNQFVLGLRGQIREDRAPFTTEREDDYEDFMNAMRSHSLHDPNELDESTNLLWIENRAYGWAIQDPAMIPYWMHPTKGIPKKGITDIDNKPWYISPPPPPDYIKIRPDRGYIPYYLIGRENRINCLLKIRNLTIDQFKELEDLLSYHYPDNLRFLHEQYLAYLKAKELLKDHRKLNEDEAWDDRHAIRTFEDAQLQWLDTFAKIGVYLIVRKPWQEVEVDLPGVFYVDDGVLSKAQLHTLASAGSLLASIAMNGYDHLTTIEKRQIAVLVRDYQTKETQEYERKRDEIMTFHGVNRFKDLQDDAKRAWRNLDQKAERARNLWFGKIKQAGRQLEFRYLHPGELKGNDPNIVYLPWSMDSMPTGIPTPSLDIKVPAHVKALQDKINNLLKLKDLSIGEFGDPELQSLLIQVAYPKLRRLLIPWITIKDKQTANEQLSPMDIKAFALLDVEVKKLWNDWIEGMGNEVKIKMPAPHMRPESPDILYWRLPPRPPPSTNPDAPIVSADRAIKKLLKTDYSAIPPDSEAMEEFWEKAHEVFREVQYPALRRLDDDFTKNNTETRKSSQNKEWFKKFQPWVRSKLGHEIDVKRPLPLFSPDDDPSIVYFHGPLPETRATKEIRDRMDITEMPDDVIQMLDDYWKVPKVGNVVPPYILYLQRCADGGGDIDLVVLDWHYDYLIHGPLTDNSHGLLVFNLPDSSINLLLETSRQGSSSESTQRASEFGGRWRNTPPNSGGIGGNGGLIIGRNNSLAPCNNGRAYPTPKTTSPSSPESIGHYTRPPPFQRDDYHDQRLNVDLRKFRSQIDSIEAELNEIFVKLNNKDHYSQEQIAETMERMDNLLEQFLPDDIFNMMDRNKRFFETITSYNSKKASASLAGMQIALERMQSELHARFKQWQVDELQSAPGGVYVRLSANPEDQREGAALFFQPGITGIGNNFTVIAPQNPLGPVGTSPLGPHHVQDLALRYLQVNEDYYHKKLALLGKLCDRINVLLRKRRDNGPLNWEDEEELLDKLLGFIPPSLSRLEGKTWELDQKMRDAKIPYALKDEEEFEAMNQNWTSSYDFWLESFPESGITIGTGPKDYDKPGALFLEDPDFWMFVVETEDVVPGPTRRRRMDPRSRELGKHVKARVDGVNKFIAATADSQQLLEDEDLDLLLRPAYRHIGHRLRALTHNDLKLPPNASPENGNLRPEDHILVETTQTIAYRVWKASLRDAMPQQRLRIVEFSPGRYHTYHGSEPPSSENLVSPYPQNFVPRCDDSAMKVFNVIWRRIEDCRTQFRSIAARVRNRSWIDESEVAIIEKALCTFGANEVFAHSDVTAKLFLVLVNISLLATDNAVLQREYLLLLLTTWARMYPEIVEPYVSRPLLSPVERLLGATLPGEKSPADVPAISPPSNAEIRELEIEMNNLLARELCNCIHPSEQDKLNFLLRALLPPSLRALKDRINKLHENYISLPGLTMNESIQYLAARNEYKTQFADFKSKLPRCGILLDKWWYSKEGIAEACSRARLWKEATDRLKYADKYPQVSKTIEDVNLRQWHDLYLELREYANQDDEIPATEERLLFPSMPAELVTLLNEIRRVKVRPDGRDNAKARRQAAWHEHVKGKFITSWMKWISTIPPSNLIPPKDGVIQGGVQGLNNHRPIDFSSKAERRGIKRAAIELALNLLASNQEQHRPLDVYRSVDQPSEYQPIKQATPLSLPLEPWQRHVELDTWEYTKKLVKYQEAKEVEYNNARIREESDHPGEIPAPANYKGPFAQAAAGDLEEAKRAWLAQLAQVVVRLQHASLDAPRPLLQELLMCYANGNDANRPADHSLDQGIPLTTADVKLLNELAEPSWDETMIDYPKFVQGTPEYANSRAHWTEIKKFEAELNALDWQGRTWQPAQQRTIAGTWTQEPYDEHLDSTRGYLIREITNTISTNRIRKAREAGVTIVPQIVSEQVAESYLSELRTLRRIHINDLAAEPSDTLIAKIPLSGHPENKYIVSREAVHDSPGVKYDADKCEYQVQYTACGKKGPPIVQPNKYEHLRAIAYRVGRDIFDALTTRSAPNTTSRKLLRDQWQALTNTEARMSAIDQTQNLPTLQHMALELHAIAPDLAKTHGFKFVQDPAKIDEREAAMLLQMQVIEEINNAWESRFPENERVWDFAADRLEPQIRILNGRTVEARPRLTQFFSVRRFPPEYQSQATQDAIVRSGPQVQTRPTTTTDHDADTAAAPTQQTVAQQQADTLRKKARHIKGQRPNFPFGETPYHQAYQSWLMEYDLRDVPEFQPVAPPRPGLFGRRLSPEPVDRDALPELPAEWQPDNISAAEKRAQLIEAAKRTPGFPNPTILEYYHTLEEIATIKQREAFQKLTMEIEVANHAIEELLGIPLQQVTPQEYNSACDILGIDKQTGKFRRNAAGNAGIGPTAARPSRPGPSRPLQMMSGGLGDGDTASELQAEMGPAGRTRSKSPKKTDMKWRTSGLRPQNWFGTSRLGSQAEQAQMGTPTRQEQAQSYMDLDDNEEEEAGEEVVEIEEVGDSRAAQIAAQAAADVERARASAADAFTLLNPPEREQRSDEEEGEGGGEREGLHGGGDDDEESATARRVPPSRGASPRKKRLRI